MPEIFWQGLLISIIGISMTFVALGLIIVAIVILERTFRVPTVAPAESGEEPAARSEADEDVAVIAAALAHLGVPDIYRSSLGSTLELGPSKWWRGGPGPIRRGW